MADRFISMDEVLDRIGFSKTHLYRLINAGSFVKPVPLGAQKVGFLEREVDEWFAARLRARDEGEGAAARRQLARSAVAARRGRKIHDADDSTQG